MSICSHASRWTRRSPVRSVFTTNYHKLDCGKSRAKGGGGGGRGYSGCLTVDLRMIQNISLELKIIHQMAYSFFLISRWHPRTSCFAVTQLISLALEEINKLYAALHRRGGGPLSQQITLIKVKYFTTYVNRSRWLIGTLDKKRHHTRWHTAICSFSP